MSLSLFLSVTVLPPFFFASDLLLQEQGQLSPSLDLSIRFLVVVYNTVPVLL